MAEQWTVAMDLNRPRARLRRSWCWFSPRAGEPVPTPKPGFGLKWPTQGHRALLQPDIAQFILSFQIILFIFSRRIGMFSVVGGGEHDSVRAACFRLFISCIALLQGAGRACCPVLRRVPYMAFRERSHRSILRKGKKLLQQTHPFRSFVLLLLQFLFFSCAI